MFVWFSYPEKTWRRWELFATIAPCAHIARLFNDIDNFSMFKINLSYFPSRARLNFRWIFKEFDLKSNMKGFFENFLALSVKKLKKVLMIFPSITGRGQAFFADSCRYTFTVSPAVFKFTFKFSGLYIQVFVFNIGHLPFKFLFSTFDFTYLTCKFAYLHIQLFKWYFHPWTVGHPPIVGAMDPAHPR